MLGSTRETSKKLSRTIVIKGARETISKRPQSLNVGQYQIISLQLNKKEIIKMDSKIIYQRIANQEIDKIKELWEGLKNDHKSKSDFFKERFDKLTFETRKEALLEKARKGFLIIDVVKTAEGKIIAYCVSSIDTKNEGEIDSIYVDVPFRRKRIGEELINRALNWFNDKRVLIRRIVVAQGNEEAFLFYQKFGFYHLFSTLQQKPER